MAGVGAWLLFESMVSPLLGAVRGLQEIGGLSCKSSVVGLMLFFMGFVFIAKGERALSFLNPPHGWKRVLSYFFWFALVGVGFGAHFLIRKYVMACGYVG